MLGAGPEHLLQGQAYRRRREARLHLRVQGGQVRQAVSQSVQGQISDMHEKLRFRAVSREAENQQDVHPARAGGFILREGQDVQEAAPAGREDERIEKRRRSQNQSEYLVL